MCDYFVTIVVYFCHNLSDNYVNLSDLYVDMRVIYVDLSYHDVNLSDVISNYRYRIFLYCFLYGNI